MPVVYPHLSRSPGKCKPSLYLLGIWYLNCACWVLGNAREVYPGGPWEMGVEDGEQNALDLLLH